MGAESTDLVNTSFGGNGGHMAGTPHFEDLFRALSLADNITRHVDFYNWLKEEISDYLPHELLLAAWGNFEQGEINYDVASSLPGVNTPFVRSLPFLDELLPALYLRARSNGIGWYVLHDFDGVTEAVKIWVDSRFLKMARSRMRSMLVYAMRDERDRRDSVYLFYSNRESIEIDPLTLNLLMPHVDSTLRRIKVLSFDDERKEYGQAASPFSQLSQREQQVMHWVSEGKTNIEIGVILGISHNTVKNHLKRIFKKMKVTTRAQAVQVSLNSAPVASEA